MYLSTLLTTLKILPLIILKYQRRIKDQIKRGLSQSYKLFRFLQILQICRIYRGNNSDKKNIKRKTEFNNVNRLKKENCK